ncbi:MAG TPA: cupin domain-containing protein [bacterium]|nr:cupin domain-containing protein [bacterium]
MSDLQHKVLASMVPEVLNPNMKRRMLWGDRLMAAFLELKAGFVVPSHQHENEQLTYCISGTMRFFFPDRELVLRGGEVLLIPSNVPHGAEMMEDVVEMDFFSPPRQDWISGDDAYLRR